MKNNVKYIFILIFFILIFMILNFYKSNKIVFDDITILGLWDYSGAKNEYKLTSQNTVEIDIFSTINKNVYRKIAPGSCGSFIIKFKKPLNSNYIINIIEKTSKPQNLVFLIENKEYKTLEETQYIINKKFMNTEKVTINWKWKYHIDDAHDVQDTKDGKNAQKYLFEIKAIVEENKKG